jgi:outer membrane receptor protein involved in Fe transport
MRRKLNTDLSTGLGTVVLAILVGQASAAGAQTASPGGTNASEEIIVTANKREESINKVGLTIKALGAAQLEQQRVTTLADLSAAVPGLSFAQTENATPVYTLRGIGFYDTAIGSPPAVSVYLDQAPLSYPVMTALTLFDIERIEVLKGPQGTLFGNNATGGAINYIAAKPTRDPQAGLSLTYARFNTFTADGHISGPLTENLLGRIAISATSGDGWQRSISRPNDTNGAPETFAARFLLDWRPTDRLRIQTNLNGWRDRSQPTAAQFVAFIPNYPIPLPGGPLIPNATDNPRLADWTPETAPKSDNRLLQATARVDYDITDSIVFTSLTSYADYKQNMQPEGDGEAEQRNDIVNFIGSIKSFSQEIRLADNTDPTFRWTVGANYSDDRIKDSLEVLYRDDTAHYAFGFDSNNSSVNQTAKSYAGFASGEYTIGQFTLKGGARYTQTNRRANNCTSGFDDNGQNPSAINPLFEFLSFLQTGVMTPVIPGQCLIFAPAGLPGVTPGSLLVNGLEGKLNQHNISWRGGIDWKPANDVLVYANVSKGYKAGSFGNFGGPSALAYAPVTQESVVTYEGGIKTQLFDRKLSLTGAVFYSDYTNKQIKSKKDSGPPFGYLLALVNVPKSSIKGFELEATVHPVSGLTIGGAVTYLDTKIKNAIGPNGLFLPTLVPPAVDSAGNPILTNSAGNPIPFAPKWSLAGNFNYRFMISGSTDAFLGGQITYRTKTNASIGNEAITEIPGYTTVDLQAGIDFSGGKYSAMIWGKNVFNEFYITNRNFSFDGVAQFAGRPATYGITLSAKF